MGRDWPVPRAGDHRDVYSAWGSLRRFPLSEEPGEQLASEPHSSLPTRPPQTRLSQWVRLQILV